MKRTRAAAFVDNSSFNVSERNSMAITLKSHAVRGRPTLKLKRVRLNKVAQHEKKYLLNCSVRIYQRIIKTEVSITYVFL